MNTKNLDPMTWLRNRLLEQDGDLPRDMLQVFAQTLMNSEAEALCGAEHSERTDNRSNYRNGYRARDWDTRAGSIELQIPKLRKGSYFPEWLLSPRRRAEKALTQVVVESYVKGVSTRRVDKLVKAMGIDGISKSQVSKMAKELDEQVTAFRNRPLDNGPYAFLWVDAIEIKCRENGRIVNVSVVVATAVNQEGRREVVGMDILSNETGSGWTSFLRELVERGLHGLQLVISDAHAGLKKAIASVFSGVSWQRCRTHFMRNLLKKVPKSAQDMVATLVRSVFTQPDAQSTRAHYRKVAAQLEEKFIAAAEMLYEHEADVLAFTAFPKCFWKQVWSNNPQERLNKEIRRRTDVVGIFPNRDAIFRLVGALLAEQTDEWAECRKYMNAETIKGMYVRETKALPKRKRRNSKKKLAA